MRSIFDFISASIGLLILLPIIFVVSIGIMISSGWPILFLDERVGHHGKLFLVLKFRTMHRDASRMGPGITTNGDKRITYLGTFLRKYKLDELPQLFNVIRGEMSLVGPRPERPEFVKCYTKIQRGILNYRPGITSPSSLQYRHETDLLSPTNWKSEYLEKVLPQKIEIDMDYFATRTITKDLKIIFRTVESSLFPRWPANE